MIVVILVDIVIKKFIITRDYYERSLSWHDLYYHYFDWTLVYQSSYWHVNPDKVGFY